MDTENPNPDAPLKAFFGFWWGLAAFVVFGIAALIAFASSGGSKDSAYEEKIAERLENRKTVDAAQADAFGNMKLDFSAAAAAFTSKGAKTEKPALGTAAHAKLMEEQAAAAAAAVAKTEEAKKEEETKSEGTEKTEGDKPKAAEVQKITLLPVPNVMQFKEKKLEVKAGVPVELTFNNTDVLQHNVLILKPGTKDKVGALADAMIADPQGMAKGYIPKSDDIIVASKLLSQGQSDTIKFTLDKPGDYPYICTFPGHWRIMNGVMTAK